MMPLSLILWLMMQGQQPSSTANSDGTMTANSITWNAPQSGYIGIINDGTGHLKVRDSDDNIVEIPVQCDPLNADRDGAYWTNCHIIKPAPAEHVIEIRTRTEHKVCVKANYTSCPVRVIHEVWI